MNHEICSKPDGSAVEKKEEKQFNLYKMNSTEIKSFDCGKRGHPRFPGQNPMAATKPLLSEVVEALQKSAHAFPFLNIEIKTEGKRGDNLYHPEPMAFVNIVLQEIDRLKITDKVSLQSFDVRILQEIKSLRVGMPVSFLVENMRGLSWNLKKLGFVPDTYSCHYKLLSKRTVEKCHKLNMKMIPWTVNNVKDMEKLIKMGVDGIITDYPNLISICTQSLNN
jgi:glycerophosphoryl diester phosphodiesterase